MNRDRPEKIDQDCNVCGSPIEVGSAWSRCSDRDCPTRETEGLNEKPYDGLPSLSTDSTEEEVAGYWEHRAREAENDGPSQAEVDEVVESEYEEYLAADSVEKMNEHAVAANALTPLSSYSGLGEVAESVEQ